MLIGFDKLLRKLLSIHAKIHIDNGVIFFGELIANALQGYDQFILIDRNMRAVDTLSHLINSGEEFQGNIKLPLFLLVYMMGDSNDIEGRLRENCDGPDEHDVQPIIACGVEE